MPDTGRPWPWARQGSVGPIPCGDGKISCGTSPVLPRAAEVPPCSAGSWSKSHDLAAAERRLPRQRGATGGSCPGNSFPSPHGDWATEPWRRQGHGLPRYRAILPARGRGRRRHARRGLMPAMAAQDSRQNETPASLPRKAQLRRARWAGGWNSVTRLGATPRPALPALCEFVVLNGRGGTLP